jgi:hypothetical protein
MDGGNADFAGAKIRHGRRFLRDKAGLRKMIIKTIEILLALAVLHLSAAVDEGCAAV